MLYEPGAPIRHVYFPINCPVSLLTTVKGHQALEVGVVGQEGMVGISLALGIDVSPARALAQGTGIALRMEATRFREEFLSDMLGVRRVSVNIAASALQKRRLIKYRHGRITILDGKRLGAASCECYMIIKRIYDSV